MVEPTRLTIRFQGDQPGLKEHRLSASAFSEPFQRLAGALRRIASNIDSDAAGSDYGHRGGQFTAETKGVDWEIISLNGATKDEPLEVTGVVVQRFETPLPFEYPESTDLTDQAAELFLNALQKESGGQRYHSLVRKYLRSLPDGLTHQEYKVSTTRGESLKPVVIGEINLPEREKRLPFLEEALGDVVGVGFDPGINEVRLKVPGGMLSLVATPEQVASALELRGRPVAAFFARAPAPHKSRLLELRAGDKPRRFFSMKEAEEAVFRRWGGFFKGLSGEPA